MTKSEFVQKHLEPMLKELDSSIEYVEYKIDILKDEYIEIMFTGGHIKNICVTCNSKMAIVTDVLRQLY